MFLLSEGEGIVFTVPRIEESALPIVRIDIQAGKTTAYKRSLLHGVRDAITEALGVPAERVLQRIVETPAEDIDAPEARSDRLTIIEISMLPGRGADLKRNLYTHIVKRLGFSPGVDVGDIVILVHDPAAECFFINGAMQCDVAKPPAATQGEDE